MAAGRETKGALLTQFTFLSFHVINPFLIFANTKLERRPMTKAIRAIFILITILIISNSANSSEISRDAKQGIPINFSGVYKGYVDSFGVCGIDIAKAVIYINYDTSPMTIIYDGCVLEHYSYVGEVVYYTGEGKQIELGYFDLRKGKLGFYYMRILNHFFYGDTTGYKPFFWTKTDELDVNNSDYKGYLADYSKFKEYWSGFQDAFFKKGIDKLASYTSFPIMDNTQTPPVKIDKDGFAKFVDMLNDNILQIRGGKNDYNNDQWFPQRFGDNDPCFAKSYMWSYTSPRLNFTKVNGVYKLTGAYEYE